MPTSLNDVVRWWSLHETTGRDRLAATPADPSRRPERRREDPRPVSPRG
ncbi:hypothetical protein [Jatrophihabitans endophyticus]|nr:hypothetical protein [Jatrophihabitans endophyticus]